jgi:nickel-type superoxide dismutase maturation protease
MLNLLKVSGMSLAPEYQEGDFVLIAKIPFLMNRLQTGDVVVFRHPLHGVLIKKVESVSKDSDEVFVTGTNANSLDSRQFGAVRVSSLLGKVIWHIRKPVQHGS